jgi:hypothetical protein
MVVPFLAKELFDGSIPFARSNFNRLCSSMAEQYTDNVPTQVRFLTEPPWLYYIMFLAIYRKRPIVWTAYTMMFIGILICFLFTWLGYYITPNWDHNYHTGGMIFGGFIGLVIGANLVQWTE